MTIDAGSDWACAINMRSKGSRCVPPREPARTSCIKVMRRPRKRERRTRSPKLSTIRATPGHLPSRCLVDISQAEAALTPDDRTLIGYRRPGCSGQPLIICPPPNECIGIEEPPCCEAYSQRICSSSGSGSNRESGMTRPFSRPGCRGPAPPPARGGGGCAVRFRSRSAPSCGQSCRLGGWPARQSSAWGCTPRRW